ncbi:MAG: polysaccharide biosynthesis/export family protein [Pyrinomonadaceae bacterium]
MKKTLLKSFLFTTAAAIFLLAGQSFGQETTNTGRRNSPFAPNPKKKSETSVAQNAGNDVNFKTEKTVKIESETKTPDVAKNDVNFQNTEFESRSAANKTLEVVKRAGITASSPTEIYKVGVGDVLFISLQNAPAKESTYFTVLKDGSIDYPLAGEMMSVQGLATDEIEKALAVKIKLYQNPQLSVNVREHNSHSYQVLGMVEKPGEKFLQREAVPLFVVRAEAIVQPKVNRVTIKRADSQTETIDLKDNKYEDVLIFSGDIVEFSAVDNSIAEIRLPQFYYIGGAIRSGGQKDYYKGLTLTQAILACGGLKKSSVQDVLIRRKNPEGLLVPTNYNLKEIKDGKIVDPNLEAGDTIEIGN